ncbi:MAG TPA: DAK2 domain-containing protein [Acidimicrobiales bacterium]
MSAPATMSAKALRATIATYAGLLREHREVINRLNVYPVPDGDTGTNMALTLESVETALAGLDDNAPLGEVAQAIAKGSLMGARGNSGVILSQLLRGLVADFPARGEVEAPALAAALARADELARQAVMRPVEGTILSVARAAAQGAHAHQGSLVELTRGARDEAQAALAHTPEQLAVLKEAGVVDSGGAGLVLFFEALCHELAGDELPVAPNPQSVNVRVHERAGETSGDLRYEVMYLLDAKDAKMHAFREVWAGLGDSIVIVGGDGLYNCHIHTDDVGAVIEASLDAGRPREIRVTDLAEQVTEERWVREASVAQEEELEGEAPSTAVVAVVVGDGVGRIFRSLGARRLVFGGQSMNPSTSELAQAVHATGSSRVIVLPNNKNITPVARQVNDLVDEDVAVVATSSIVEGFAALLAYDPDASLESNAEAMGESALAVVAGEVTQAVRDTQTPAGSVREGDWIGLSASGVASIADSIAGAANALLASLISPEHELLTIIEGEGATPANTRRITEFLAQEHPHVAPEVHHGGQPLYPYYFGLE